jgi:hypothetical protein
MRPFHVIMLAILRAEVIEVGFNEDDEMIEAFLLKRLNESLDKCVGIGRPKGRDFDVPSSDATGSLKTYCLPALILGIQIATLTQSESLGCGKRECERSSI